MELADRGTLRDWQRDGRLGSLSWAGRKALCRDLCVGMEFLHEKAGVVHRDLKPENVLFKSEATRGGRRDTLKARAHRAPFVSQAFSVPQAFSVFDSFPGLRFNRGGVQSAHHRAIDAARLPAQIADFGLSRSIAHSRSRRTTSSGGAGTDCWMPPEGLAGKCGDTASLTFSYDVHPTGSLLYCADRPGLVDGLGFSYYESMAVPYGRCGR